ncbi:MAG: hypothetical protein IJ298_08300 [Ruminococcus sp.]|nr:hypothetical protein [Ruminococcus sp.]
MKKVFAICLALVMVFSLSVTVCAAPGSFVNSPSNNNAPVIEEFENESDDCTADLDITSFGDRNSLSDADKKEMEDAYDMIKNSTDLTDMFSGLNAVVDDLDILPSDLAVSDLFHIDYTDCVEHDEHGAFKIKLSADTLKGFAGLIQYINGEWKLIDNAKVEDDEYLIFTADDLSTFAIVVDSTKSATTSPVTGDPTLTIVAGVVTLALCTAFAVVTVSKKKA